MEDIEIMARNSVIFENLTGGLNTVSSIGTINQSPKRTESPDMVNVEYFKLGGLRAMDGNTRIGDIQTSSVTLGFEYKKGNVKYLLITTRNGEIKIYDSVGDKFDLIYTFPNKTTRHSMVAFNDGVVITNGVDDLIYYEKDRHAELSGDVNGTSGSTTVTGAGTKFTSELKPGDSVEIDGNVYFVNEVTDDEHITLRTELLSSFSNSRIYLGEISECNAKLVNEDDPLVDNDIRGLAIQLYKGRLLVGGNDGTLYYSELGKYNGWDVKYGAGGIPPFYNDTSDIFALGLFASYLLIHRKDYTYVLTGESDTNTWEIQPYADISCESQQSFVSTNNMYFVYSRSNGGIYPLLKRTIYNDRFVGDEISTKIRSLFDSLNMNRLDEIYCVSYPKKRYMIMYMPFLEGTGSNIALVFDFQTASWLKRRVPQTVTCAFRYADNVYIGTLDGKVLREFDGKTFDGENINFYWKSPWFDFSDGSNYMSIREFRVQISDSDTNNFYVRNRRDGKTSYHERFITNGKGDINSLIWSDESGEITNTVWDEYNWVESGFLTRRFPLPDSYFQQIQIEFSGKGDAQAMALYGFEFDGIHLEEVPWT